MNNFKILLSTSEGYRKDQSAESKKKTRDKSIHLTFSGPEAPVKAVRVLMQKYGIRKEEL